MDCLFGFPAILFLTLDCHYALFGVGQLQALTKAAILLLFYLCLLF